MNRNSLSVCAALQKRRSKIAIGFRLAVFLGVTLTYFLLHIFSKTDYIHDGLNGSSNRKLLSIPQGQSSSEQTVLNTITNGILNSKTEFNILPKTLTTLSTIYQKNFGRSSRGSSGDGSDVDGYTIRTKNISSNIIIINSIDENCTLPAINDFPNDGFTRAQRQHGWIIIHILLACYCFWILGAVCDDYFVPAIELLCRNLEMQRDVVGATFMAAATSSAELFINSVGTFVTEGDIGIGTIVGSAIFNILAVPACCGIFSGQVIKLDWWPITRDALMYCAAVLGLIATIYDGKVMWYEALLLVLSYLVYLSGMYYNDFMAIKTRNFLSKCRRRRNPKIRPYREVTEITPLFTSGMTKSSNNIIQMEPILETPEYQENYDTDNDGSDFADDPWNHNDSNSLIVFILRWPITLLLWLTIPDCRKYPKLRFLSLLLAICWIGSVSYLIAFLITVVGDTFNIPDSVMGLTILAAGMSIPEAVSSVIVTKQGYGAMGICNSIGSNTFDILLCLGLPWFIKSYFMPSIPNEQWITLKSNGIQYSAISLLISLFGLYILFLLNKFYLDWKIGIVCCLMYIGFLILSSMIELNYFYNFNLPICVH